MITVHNIRNTYGDLVTLHFESANKQAAEIDAAGEWLVLPALTDAEPCTDVKWETKASQAVSSGITSVFYVSHPSDGLSVMTLQAEKEAIKTELGKIHIPIRSHIYGEITKESIENLGKFKSKITAIKIPETRDLDADFLNRVFQLAAQEEVIVAFSAVPKSPGFTDKMLRLAEKYATQVLVLNISTLADLTLLREAIKSEISIDAGVSAPVLLSTDFLWEALHDQSIDYVTSGKGDQKLLLAALLDGYHRKKLAIEEVVALGMLNAEKNFRLSPNQDLILIDLQYVKAINGEIYRGWPRYTVINGVAYPSN